MKKKKTGITGDTVKTIAQWFFGIACFGGAFGFGLHWGILPLLLAGILFLPIPFIRRYIVLYTKMRPWMIVALASVLLVVGVSLSPTMGRSSGTLPQSTGSAAQVESTQPEEATTVEATTVPTMEKTTETTTTTTTTKSTTTTTTTEPTTTTTITKPTTTTTKPTTTTTWATTTQTYVAPQSSYVINTGTGKFHKPGCSGVEDILPENRWDFNGTREEVVAKGYVPCKRCYP